MPATPASASPDDEPPIGEALARFVTGLRLFDLPPAVRHEARRSLLNGLATALAGCCEPALLQADRALAPFSGSTCASVIGRPGQRDPLHAASLNAMAINVFDYDDTHPPTIIHPTAPVAPVVLALAQALAAGVLGGACNGAGRVRTVSGAQALVALVAGIEVECRLGNAMAPGHYADGWHITATCGVFGATAAAAMLLGLSTDALQAAWGNAAVQASGLVEALGTSAKSIGVGNAARNGIVSALLAAQGFGGPARPLDGTRGYLRVAAREPRLSAVLDGLGTTWESATNTYKPYPCGVVLNPVIDACLELASQRRLVAPEIASITLTGHPLLRQRTDRPQPATGRLAQVSAQHAVPVALLRGRAGLDEFSDAAVADPDCRALGARLSFVDDPALGVESAVVAIVLHDGQRLERRIEHARGSAMRPLTDGELEAKLQTLARHGGARIDTARLADAVWQMETLADAGEIARLAAGVNPRESA